MTSIDGETYASLARLAMRLAGLHLPETKRAFVLSRLQRRLRHLGLRDFDAYLALLRMTDEPGRAEQDAFVSALTTNVTEVFREPHHFVLLAEHLDRWRADRSCGASRFRIWSAGCATGEEPLSIASTCRAVLGTNWRARVRILATDVDRAVIARVSTPAHGIDPEMAARLARLPEGVTRLAHGSGAPRQTDPGDLLSGIEFKHHNLLAPLPHDETFDVIFCRNVTIYFDDGSRDEAHTRLRDRLLPEGLLAIGHSERLAGIAPDMVPIGRTAYRKVTSRGRLTATGGPACR